jgi:hypothetical protein
MWSPTKICFCTGTPKKAISEGRAHRNCARLAVTVHNRAWSDGSKSALLSFLGAIILPCLTNYVAAEIRPPRLADCGRIFLERHGDGIADSTSRCPDIG